MTVRTNTSISSATTISASDEKSELTEAIASYLEYTKTILPNMAKSAGRHSIKMANSTNSSAHSDESSAVNTKRSPVKKNKADTWPIHNDHCFQRVVLDTICHAAWYDVIPSPAYKNLSLEQARAANALCEKIANHQVCLTTLNNRSKAWRNKQAKFDF
jgi:hypothetical protein